MRSERLLRGIHKVASHDLPNQMVAMHGLLHLLRLEEWDRLSEEGREYVRRLENATGRAGGMARFLKEIARLHCFTPRPENITLTALAREIQGELQHRHPAKEFAFRWQWDAPTLTADPRVLMEALQELFVGLLSPAAGPCAVSARSLRKGKRTELHFVLEESVAAAPLGATAELRMEFILAREWLALSGGAVELTPPSGGTTRFSLLIPDR